MNKEILQNAGIDFQKGLSRFMDDEEFYEKILVSFLADAALEKAEIAYAQKNCKELFYCAHEIKGSSGNTDMTRLYQASCKLSDVLRNREDFDEELIAPEFEAFKKAYIEVKQGITDAMQE